jgi:flagellar biosynthesis activator protein FlaF
MQSAAKAYGAVARKVANPRDLEADLLLKAAAQLQSVYDDWDNSKKQLDPALQYNRKLWTILLAAVTKPENPLPPAIRQNVVNLGVFVMNQTMTITQEAKREQLLPLININRELASGLLGRG